ncbi:MAG: arsenate reductase ArsC [Streptosporangiales bacterium]|nr:arsenate reductase ArsC [Streptosporangiales bacterium]
MTRDGCADLESCHVLDAGPVLDRAAAHLAERYTGTFAYETVRDLVRDSYIRLTATARIHTYLPVLATRLADDRLRATAKIRGVLMPTTPEVLFVCVHNAGRSQMAAALLDHHAAGRVLVRSAGSTPASQINPAVVEAMDELGLDLSKEFPKPLTDEAVQAADVVVTMGCGDACPVYPGKRYLDWDLPDPAGQPLETVRAIRDQIDTRVRSLLADLALAPG